MKIVKIRVVTVHVFWDLINSNEIFGKNGTYDDIKRD